MGGILMLDTMANRYHLLPTEIVDRGSSLDAYVLTNALDYYRRQREDKPSKPKLSVDEMLAMVRAVKERKWQ